jgi:hypothetical protein
MSTPDTPVQPDRPRKIGEGHAAAMLRQGLKELQAAVVDPSSNVAREPEPGTFGTPTQGEIASDRRPDIQPSALDKHAPSPTKPPSASSPSRDRTVHDGPSSDMSEPERE